MSLKKIDKEEILERIWVLRERGIKELDVLIEKSVEPEPRSLVRELEQDGYVTIEGNTIEFTPEGEAYARSIIRRLRLAEVLFSEILDMDDMVVRHQACEFEHILMSEVTDSICTFLGHPKRCPHGWPIPPGDCCEHFSNDIKPFVKPLSELGIGEFGKIVFMSPKTHTRLDKLMNFGIIPGSIVKLHQKRPSFVIQIGETDLAIDPEIAKNIYVKRVNGDRIEA